MAIENKYVAPGVAIGAVCLTALLCTVLLANGNFYIKNLGSSVEQNGRIVNSLSVTGDGKVFAKPDTVILTVSASELAGTSKEALESANSKVKQAVQVALANGVEEKDIQTSNLSINAEYDYNNGNQTFKGQRANVSVNIKVRGVDANASKATKIIDEVAAIDRIQLGSISFDIEDKTALFSQARELAFNKAKQKAEELAKLGSLRLLKPVSISDTATDITPPSPYLNTAGAEDARAVNLSTAISTGQLEVSINLSVIWGIE